MRRTIVIIAAVGILGLVGILVRQLAETSGRREAVFPIEGETASPAAFTPPARSKSDGQDAANEAAGDAAQGFGSRFHASADLWQFAESIHPAAQAGDPAAQYYLSRTLKYCDDSFRFYFVRGNRRRTLDEGMQWASTRAGLEAEEAREVHARCSRLQETSHSFGTAGEWLSASKEKGFSLAMIDTARQLAVTAGVSGATQHVEMRDEAKRLALRALESKDPQVIFDMGDLAVLFVEDMKKASQEQWVWRLAACKRGYECGPDAEWVQLQCRFDPNCQPYESGIDFIRRMNSEDFDEIERLANDLNARLDAGGFEWPGS